MNTQNDNDIMIWEDEMWCYRDQLEAFGRVGPKTVLFEGTEIYETFLAVQ